MRYGLIILAAGALLLGAPPEQVRFTPNGIEYR